MDLDGYDWSTYLKLKEDKILGSKENQDWSEGRLTLARYTNCDIVLTFRSAIVHKEILYTGTIPKSVKGEQLMAQLFGCIINKMALHSLGRIQMVMWIPTSLYVVSIATLLADDRNAIAELTYPE
jgi:transcription factor 1